MSWFEGGGLSGFAKTAFTNAQKSIDRVLDIQDEESAAAGTGTADSGPTAATGKTTRGPESLPQEQKASARQNKQTHGTSR